MQEYRSINPATGEVLAEYPPHSPEAVESALSAADAAFRQWRRSDFAVRSRCLEQLAALLRRERSQLARLMAVEMGKPLSEGAGEIEKCARLCEYYAGQAAEFCADEVVAPETAAQTERSATRDFVSYQPLGIIFAIMPWNFPFWQALRAAVPALAAGNAMLLKHAPNVGGCALALETILREALETSGGPPELFANLFVDHPGAGAIIDHPLVRGVTFTGSTAAGRSIAARAGASLKPTVLELGGSDPYLILEDADIRQAATLCVQSRLINGGQSCIAAKRFIAVAGVFDEFLQATLDAMRLVLPGDPLEADTTLGPLARPDLRATLHRQVEESVAGGARLLLGGKIPRGPGAFYPPTLLSGVTHAMPAGREELFGPVAAVLHARDEDHAVELANSTTFGLGAAIFTRDRSRAERLARESIEAGSVFINDFVKSRPHLPFGGVKDSGYGRELGLPGLRAFVNIRTIQSS